MKNYSLSIYRISISRRSNRSWEYHLCDFCNGKDFLVMMNEMLTSWQHEGYKSEVSRLTDTDSRISRIKQLPDGTFARYLTGRYLSGIIESGEYGTEESIIDSDTGELKYIKVKGDAPMVPFYFMFSVPENSRYGYLILERIGNVGISTLLARAISMRVWCDAGWNYVPHIEPFMIQEVYERNISLISDAKKVILRGVSNASATLREITGSLIDEDVRGDMVFSAGRGSLNIRSWLDMLNGRKTKGAPYSFKNIECVDVAFQLNIGGRSRTVSMGRIGNLGTSMEITGEVELGSDGYPTFDSINRQAQELLSYIKDEEQKG